MKTITECVGERVLRGARTFMVKVKGHRGESLNERADTQAQRARRLPEECPQWTNFCTARVTYDWHDKGVKRVPTWSNVCMLQFQEAEDKKTPATTTWAAEFLLRAEEIWEKLRFVD